MEEIWLSPSPSVIAQLARRAGLTQEQIAKAVYASQSQVSRVLAGKSVRQSRLYDEICIYVNNAFRGVSAEAVRENRELIEALASVWDGTGHHATALATVIRSLGELNPVAGRRRATSVPSAKEVANVDTRPISRPRETSSHRPGHATPAKENNTQCNQLDISRFLVDFRAAYV